ncbi:hypothetical protein B0H16DRAFT_1607378 [Mycena metata]|uniref:Novel STAND NTPase 1 domain-containing protein n=1 Tax=Mycena metata TaxID=1033252 RepID=A0AAD7HET3_9AGAR|nr:hypothetical protein B0H16DRAFT_1607378 [Mycena metata]
MPLSRPNKGDMAALLKDCKKELQQGFHCFQISSIITEVKQMQEQAEARHREVLELVEIFSNSDSNSQVYSTSYASSNSISMLPAEPKIFHGREAEVADILKLFNEASPRIAILGAGGMGKTSLARAVLHHNEITARYSTNRFFIACDGLKSEVDLAGLIGTHIGLKPQKHPVRAVLKHLAAVQPTLLVLDNLETLWDPIESHKEIEEFLSLLTDIPSLALMITMRGAERPGQVKWTRPFLPPLEPLAPDAAQRMFLEIADDGHSIEEVNQILALTDNMPLVISLLGHLVDTEGCSQILSRWETEKTSLLSEGYDKRSNLKLSISLSLSSARMTRVPHAQDLLSLLSTLPDGLSDVELKQAQFPTNDILACKTALLRTSLAYMDDHGRLKALVPIREYMQNLLPATSQMIRPLFKHFQELLELFNEHHGKVSGTSYVSRIALNFANIQSILQNTLQQGHPDLVASIYCTCHLSRFSRFSRGPHISLFPLLSPLFTQICDPKLEVYMITEIVRSWSASRVHASHQQNLETRGTELCNHFNDPDVKYNFYSVLSAYYINCHGQSTLALKHAHIALSLAQSTENKEMQSKVFKDLALIKFAAGDYTAGQEYAKECNRLAAAGNLFKDAQGLHVEALNWLELGNYMECISLINRALHLLDMCAMSQSLTGNSLKLMLGAVQHYKSEYAEAYDMHNQAAQSAVNHPYALAIVLMNMADLEVSMGTSKNEIQNKINEAQRIFKQLEVPSLSIGCDTIQATLNLREGDMTTALFRKCLREGWGKDSDIVWHCLERLGDVSCWADHHELSWSIVLFVYSLKHKKRLQIYKGLQFMGDMFLQGNDEATALSLFTLALHGFTQMDIHRSRAECMIRLGDISEKNRDSLNALELWEMARPLFKRSLQMKQIQAIDERVSKVNQDVKEQHQRNLARLAELSVPAEKVDTDDSDPEMELERADVEREVEQVVI